VTGLGMSCSVAPPVPRHHEIDRVCYITSVLTALSCLAMLIGGSLEAPPEPSIVGAPRSAALVQAELGQAQYQLTKAARLIPAWPPVVGGAGLGLPLGGVGLWLLLTRPSGLEGIFHVVGGIMLGALGGLLLVIGVVATIVLAIGNAVQNDKAAKLTPRVNALREELERARQREALEPWRSTSGSFTAPTALLEF